ncbi:AAA family ATPase [Nakamurella alba]|nr:AAA family ATPase [Nakamurella alba]
MQPRIREIHLTTPGQKVATSRNVTLIVGPNNAGKSALLYGILHEMQRIEGQQGPDHPIVDSLEVEMPSKEDLREFFAERSEIYPPGTYRNTFYQETTYVVQNGTPLQESVIDQASNMTNRFGPNISSSLIAIIGPEGRGAGLSSRQAPDLMNNQAPQAPLDFLWADRDLEEKMNGHMHTAFGENIVVNRHAGPNVHLHVGRVETPEPRIGDRSPYMAELMALPLFNEQGAGMQAFMGTVATLSTDRRTILLFDEPEAFLHPPQARLLGTLMVQLARETKTQVIASTHSDDLVRGVLDGAKTESEVTLARITRPSHEKNRIAQVTPSTIKDMYSDPLLRFSKILDGIFYKGVVLCEAEMDCTYYSAVLQHVEETKELAASDLLFTHSSGKDRLERSFSALHAASVPVAVIADVDLLADSAKFRSIYEAMGGEWTVIEAQFNVLEASISSLKRWPSRTEARENLQKILGVDGNETLTASELRSIREAVRVETGWKLIKKRGRSGVDSGDPTIAFDKILTECYKCGLFVLEVGELERFHPEVGGTKQTWLRLVLEGGLYRTSDAAQKLLLRVRRFIEGLQ